MNGSAATKGEVSEGEQLKGTSSMEALPLLLDEIDLFMAGRRVLESLSLEIRPRESLAILGPNGAGKTMLLRVCHGLLRPTQGIVKWNNPTVAARPQTQAMVFQHPLMLRRTVQKNVEFAMRTCSIPRPEFDIRLYNALELAGLATLIDQQATRLSGGEKQRLVLARCCAISPEVIFLDEPTAHLDPAATRKIEHMVSRIRQQGSAIVMVTHDLGQARRLADRIVFMHHGRIIEDTPAEQFFDTPDSAEARAFVLGNLLA